jgi:hypothetical protein
MTVLTNFNPIGAAHWETGSVRHVLNYQGHSFSEALLLGISGGICVGYFTFAYQGFDPHVALLTRNTFDPLETLFDRLGVVREVRQTTQPDKGLTNLRKTLEEGQPAMVFADLYSLPYNVLANNDQMWIFIPVVAYGLEDSCVSLSDRAAVPLRITPEELLRAWGRTKDNRYKLVTLELPNLDSLPRAVQAGIESCIRLYTEAPPKGARTNFGFAALNHWADMLVKRTGKNSWAKVFPRGRALYAGLHSAWQGIDLFGTGGHASRDQYADFLDEAAGILNKPALRQAAAQFRTAATAWDALADALLPDAVEPFGRIRQLGRQKQALFQEFGAGRQAEQRQLLAEIQQIEAGIYEAFPLDEQARDDLLASVRENVLAIHDVEREAVAILGDVMLSSTG